MLASNFSSSSAPYYPWAPSLSTIYDWNVTKIYFREKHRNGSSDKNSVLSFSSIEKESQLILPRITSKACSFLVYIFKLFFPESWSSLQVLSPHFCGNRLYMLYIIIIQHLDVHISVLTDIIRSLIIIRILGIFSTCFCFHLTSWGIHLDNRYNHLNIMVFCIAQLPCCIIITRKQSDLW